jgi:Electron transfer flavoprotein domain
VSSILVFVETVGGSPDRLSAEALAFADGLGGSTAGTVDAVVVAGDEDAAGAESAAAVLGGYGVETVHLVASDQLGAYAPPGRRRSRASSLVRHTTP